MAQNTRKLVGVILMLAMLVAAIAALTVTTSAADTTVEFALGDNGSAAHADGSTASSYTETVDNYTLTLSGMTKAYTGARDAKGNSCIKLGTSSATGGFSFDVPSDVTSVVIHIAKYKANTTKITVNGTAYTLTNNSNDGAYDAITVDTSTTKTVTLTTVSGGVRAMVNGIDFVVPSSGGDSGEPECAHENTTTTTVDATCTEAGSTTITCDDCGETLSTEEIEATGHSYAEGVCTSCGEAQPASLAGRYYIATVRGSGNYFYMTSNLGTASTKRYQAEDSGLTALPESINAPQDGYVFVLELNDDGTYCIYAEGVDGNNYLGWTSGNSGALVAKASALDLTITANDDGTYVITNSTASRNLELNSTNNYFAWYGGTQVKNLYLVPVVESTCNHVYDEGVVTPPSCTEEGYTTYTCTVLGCGFYYTDNKVPATGHTYVEGWCDCGYPEAGTALTISQAIALGNRFEHSYYTEGMYYVTGKVVTEPSGDYGNLYIEDAEGNQIYVYGIYDGEYGAEGTKQYKDMENKPVLGDIITVYAVIGKHNGNSQIKNAWMTEIHEIEPAVEFLGAGMRYLDAEGNTVSTDTVALRFGYQLSDDVLAWGWEFTAGSKAGSMTGENKTADGISNLLFTNIAPENFNTDINVRIWYNIKVGGSIVTIYDEVWNARSVAEVVVKTSQNAADAANAYATQLVTTHNITWTPKEEESTEN